MCIRDRHQSQVRAPVTVLSTIHPMDNSRLGNSSVPTFKPAGGALDGVDIVACFKEAFYLRFLVCGRTGVGKSSLINSLVGCEVCSVNDPGCSDGNFDPGTTKVSETAVNIDGVIVSIYDSPGLQDGTVNEERYLQDMYDNCKDVDLILYCMEMTASRYTPAEIRATQLITNKFGSDFWKRCVLVMTKANMVSVNPKDKGNEREYHKRLYDKFLQKFRNQLIEQGVPEDTARAIPGVATGYYYPELEDERYVWYVSDRAKPSERPVDFLSELWVTCFETISGVSQTKFLRATTRQRIKPLPVASEAEQKLKKLLEETEEKEKKMRKEFEDLLKQQEGKYKKELDQLREAYSRIPEAPPPYSDSFIVPDSDHYDRMRTRATVMRTGALAAVGGAIGGPVGAVIGGAVGAILGIFF